ncbi:MAG: acetylornithine/N-succinyldiaminopimelate aminotransferase [Alphaproteobacteria bacterium]|nr:acetylornithine/N-succinyldiaminopimelate aminotransferase [Alphaproteobacteria bacterium]
MITPVLPSYARTNLAFERGEGPYLFTATGERYLDMGGGIAVNALGHAHPVLVAALKAQAEKLWHTSNLYHIPNQQRLAERLVAASFADTAFFCNSGAEALECAIKMSRIYHYANGNPERYRLITQEGAFHGRTLATISAGGNEKHLKGFGPQVDGFDHVPFGDIAAIKAAIGPQTAGVLLEPIRGEGGIRVLPIAFLKELRALCDEQGVLLVLDEVQCGMGRTGKLWAYEWAGITPDIMAIAKAIGGGFPLGVCLATENAAKGMTAGTHGSTFGGNPLACAVGNAVLDVVLADGFLDQVLKRANRLKQQLAMLRDRHPGVIEEIHGEGLMIGIKCRITNTDLVAALIDEKMLSVGAGDNQVRLLPPLNIEDAQISAAIVALDAACAKLSAKL